MINRVIEDVSDTSLISNGEFTFGELVNDRMALYATFLRVFNISIRGHITETPLWISLKGPKGEQKEGYMWMGIRAFEGASELSTCMKIPIGYWEVLESDGAEVIDQATEAERSLIEVLKLFMINEGIKQGGTDSDVGTEGSD